MSPRRVARVARAAALLLLVGGGNRARAQSTNAIGAWDALVVSPAGALAPVVRAFGDASVPRDAIALRYGRWRYDAEDAVHDNVGLTWTRQLPFAKARLSLTGVYSMVECPTCSAWASAGAEVESTAWSAGGSSAGAWQSVLAVRLSAGGAHYLGADPTTAGSAALILPLAFGVTFSRRDALAVSVEPGVGYGHVTGADFAAGGVLPMIGGAAALSVGSRASMTLGLQRVLLAGAPTVVGAALTWHLR